MNEKNKNPRQMISIQLLPGQRDKLYQSIDKFGIKHSEGIREILIAFSEGRCTLRPPNDGGSGLYGLYNDNKE